MKKTLLSVTFGLSCLLLASCGGTKTIANSYPQYGNNRHGMSQTVLEDDRQEIEDSPMQILVNNCPENELRALGIAKDFELGYAMTYAERNGKAKLARQISELVLAIGHDYRSRTQKNNDYGVQGFNKDDVQAATEQLIKDMKIVGSKKYKTKDGKYEVEVCVSIPRQNVEVMAGGTIMTEDEKLGLQFEQNEFEKDLEKNMERFRQMNGMK